MKNEHSLGTLIPLFNEIQTTGQDLVKKVKSLIEEGNDHRLVVKKSDGHTLFEIPFVPAVLMGAGVVLFTPLVAALGVIAALVGQIEAVVERYPEPVYAVVESRETTSEPLPKS